MKLLSINIRNIVEENYIGNLHLLAELINDLDVDVICMQEVGEHKYVINQEVNPTNNAVILQNLLKEVYFKSYNLQTEMFKTAFEHFNEGLAILSKHEIKNYETCLISKTSDSKDWHKRVVQSCVINNIKIINLHLNWDDLKESFKDNFTNLMKFNNDDEVILIGDFNCPYNSQNYLDIINKYNLHPLNDVSVITHRDSNSVIDYFLTNSNTYKTKDFKVYFNKETNISDHNCLYLEI